MLGDIAVDVGYLGNRRVEENAVNFLDATAGEILAKLDLLADGLRKHSLRIH